MRNSELNVFHFAEQLYIVGYADTDNSALRIINYEFKITEEFNYGRL